MSNPQIPNPDQLQFINPKADPRTNPARYEEAPPDELVPPVPVVTLGPNAVYLVRPGYWDEKVEGAGPEPEEKAPALSSIEPDTLEADDPDTEATFVGQNFSAESKIIWNGGEEPTTFIDDKHLSTIVKPSTVQAPLPVTVQAWVVNGTQESEKLDFTFTAPEARHSKSEPHKSKHEPAKFRAHKYK